MNNKGKFLGKWCGMALYKGKVSEVMTKKHAKHAYEYAFKRYASPWRNHNRIEDDTCLQNLLLAEEICEELEVSI